MQIVWAGALYFLVTYAAGFVFGTVRELFVVPRLGQLTATLIETPVMLAVTYFAASWIIGRFADPPAFGERAAIGAIGFALLMAAEILFSGMIRGWSFEAWVGHLKTSDGAISMVLFVLFAIMPLIVRRA